MKPDEIERLLKKFAQGNISFSEEEKLRNYFSQSRIPSNLMHYKEEFLNMEKNEGKAKARPSGKKFYVWGGAAIIIVAMGIFLLQPRNLSSSTENAESSIQEKEMALKKTRETLRMVSQLMNEGKKDLVYLKEFNKTRERIIKHEN
ncbi:hypothetical protein [Salegentibacter sp. F14]